MGENTKADGAASAPPPALRRNDVSMTDMSDVDTVDNLYHVRKSRLIRLINWWQVGGGWRLARKPCRGAAWGGLRDEEQRRMVLYCIVWGSRCLLDVLRVSGHVLACCCSMIVLL